MHYQAPRHGFRTFLIVWLSQSVSALGTQISFFAINIWLVQSLYPGPEQQAQLAWALAACGLSLGVPTIVATPLAGALADRADRKKLMLTMDLAGGALLAVFAVLLARGMVQLWMLMVGFVVLAVTTAIHGAAFDTSYAMLVPDEQLPRANGMMQTTWSLAAILAPAAAAGLIAVPALARQGAAGGVLGTALGAVREGATLALAADALTFFLAAVVMAFLTIPSPGRADLAPGAAKPSMMADVRSGIAYIWRRKPLLWLLGTFAATNLLLPLGVFLPLIVKTDIAADWAGRGFTYETALAAINTAMALGGVAGGILVSLWGGLKRRRVIGLLLFMVLGGIGQVIMGFSPWMFGTAVGAFLLDFTAPTSNSHSQAIWQSIVPREMQGRVFAVRRVLATGLVPLGTVLGGWLAGRMDPGLGFGVLGLVVTIISAVQLFNPYMLKVEDKAYLDQMAESA